MELAVQLHLQFIDLDQEIEKAEKQTIKSLFASQGESHFRQLEYHHLRKATNELDAFVMATGGGTPCFFDNMDFMNTEGKTIFINTPIQTIKERLRKDVDRPLMRSNTLEDLYDQRKKWYDQASESVSSLQGLLKLFNLEI